MVTNWCVYLREKKVVVEITFDFALSIKNNTGPKKKIYFAEVGT